MLTFLLGLFVGMMLVPIVVLVILWQIAVWAIRRAEAEQREALDAAKETLALLHTHPGVGAVSGWADERHSPNDPEAGTLSTGRVDAYVLIPKKRMH